MGDFDVWVCGGEEMGYLGGGQAAADYEDVEGVGGGAKFGAEGGEEGGECVEDVIVS